MENLKRLRKEKNLTLEQLAQKLNLSRQVLSRYERGEREADYSILKRIANFFDVSIDYLLGNSTYYYPDRVRGRSTPLSEGEQELLELYNRMGTLRREDLLIYARALSGADAQTVSKKKA